MPASARRPNLLLPALAAAVLGIGPATLHAATINWVGSSGNWSDTSKWSGSGTPLNNDTVNIVTPYPNAVTVNYDFSLGSLLTFNTFNLSLIGATGGATNTLLLPGGFTLRANTENIGVAGGSGKITQSGGTHTVGNQLFLAAGAGDTGIYQLNGGTLTAGQTYVGYLGNGAFTQNAGTHTVGTAFGIGYGVGSNGDYTLSGTGALNVSLYEAVGASGAGTFHQDGGTHTVSGDLFVAQNAGSSGLYAMTAGTLDINNANLYVGNSGNGAFSQSGGAVNMGNGGPATNLRIGANAGSVGSYTLSGTGSLQLFAQANELVGDGGAGTFTQNGGTHFLLANSLTIGNQGGASGTYNLNAGTLTAGNLETIGNSGTGIFSQSAGVHAAKLLILGSQVTGNGTYNLSGGVLEFEQQSLNEIVGLTGAGTVNQNGGTNQLGTGTLNIASNAGSVGTYNLTGPGTLIASDESIGISGAGTFHQSAGTNQATTLTLGLNSGSSAVYTLSGTGSLAATFETIGVDGLGTFIQSGGTNTVTNLRIGFGQGTGSYSLSGGTAAVTNSVQVGGGTGALTVSGNGILTVGNELHVLPGSTLTLAGGSIYTSTLNLNPGFASFNWSSGLLELNSSVAFDPTALGTSGGSFGAGLTLGSGKTLVVFGNETVGGTGSFGLTLGSGGTNLVSGNLQLNPTGTITQNPGSTLAFANFIQAGGTVNGTFTNTGNFFYQGGLFNGRLVNQGDVNLGAFFIAGNGIENDTSMAIASSQVLAVNGAGLDNLGTLTMNGGHIIGSGAVTNDLGGVMNVQGPATVGQTFNNQGQLTLNSILTLNSGGSSSGAITINSGASLRGGDFENSGIVTLNGGAIAAASTNNNSGGVIQGSGSIGGSFANNAGGSIQVAAGKTITITNSWNNDGLVTIAGGTLGGGTVSNTGVIQGSGLIQSGVSNIGTLRASGGELDIAGAGSNDAAAHIQVQNGSTLLFLQGLGVNNGSIALKGGTFDNGNFGLLNIGEIVGAGTLRTGGLLNMGSMSFADSDTDVFGAVTTQSVGPGTGNVQITNNKTTFFGPVTIGADTTFTVTQGTARFLSSFVNNGTYVTDPTTSSFTDLTVGVTGAQVAAAGDTYLVSGNLVNQSTQNETFDLSLANVEITGAGSHMLEWGGADLGPQYFGYLDNFALGTLELTPGVLLLISGTSADSALYIRTLLLDGAAGDTLDALAVFIRNAFVNNVAGHTLNIFYDPAQTGNGYLHGQTFALGGSGLLQPVSSSAAASPEPSTVLGAMAGLLWLALRKRRQR